MVPSYRRGGTAYLEWHKPLHQDLVGHRVCYSYETGGAEVDQGASPIDVSNPDPPTYQVTGLTMYSLYDFWLEPYDGNGDPLGESNRVPLMATDILLHLPLASAG